MCKLGNKKPPPGWAGFLVKMYSVNVESEFDMQFIENLEQFDERPALADIPSSEEMVVEHAALVAEDVDLVGSQPLMPDVSVPGHDTKDLVGVLTGIAVVEGVHGVDDEVHEHLLQALALAPDLGQ